MKQLHGMPQKNFFVNLIINTPSVISLTDLEVRPIEGVVPGSIPGDDHYGLKEDRVYSNYTFLFEARTKNGIIRPPQGTIFELRYPENDIKGIAL